MRQDHDSHCILLLVIFFFFPKIQNHVYTICLISLAAENAPSLDKATLNTSESAAINGQGRGIEEGRLFQRKFVKSHAFQYISFDLIPSSRTMEPSTPSRLSIARAIENSLLDLNGIVNGSFNWDLLHIQPHISEKKEFRVVLKVPSR